MTCKLSIHVVYRLDTMIYNLRMSFTINYLGGVFRVVLPISEPGFEFLCIYRTVVFLCLVAFQGLVDIV